MHNINIVSGGGGGRKYVIFTGYCLYVPRVLARVVVADKEEAKVAKVIDKTFQRQPGVRYRDARALGRTRWSRPENVARGRGNSGRQPLKCYSCTGPFCP